MGLNGSIQEHNSDTIHQLWTICTHSYSNLTHVSPVVFLYLLKECYFRGESKAKTNFQSLQQTVLPALYNVPRPGPATFIAHCLVVLPIFESYYEEFGHLIISCLRHLLRTYSHEEDIREAKYIAAQLFCNIVWGMGYDEKVLIKILEVFSVNLEDIEYVICISDVKEGNGLDAAKACIQQYISYLLESKSYKMAVTFLEHFSLHQSGEYYLSEMIKYEEYKEAEKWATSMGMPMLCLLVQQYIDKSMLKYAYDVITKKTCLQDVFPEIYLKGKQSSIKKFAEKGLWDMAEARARKDRQQLEYLVTLAKEAGYFEKVEELCDRYSLEGYANVEELQESLQNTRFFSLDELAVDDIIWVDDVSGLQAATCHIEGCTVVGIDSEGMKPQVCIMQIASEKMVYILDLIKLFKDVPVVLDSYLTRIFRSPKILKLGYDFQGDAKQLALSYASLRCFKHYEMLLDIQKLFDDPSGGLSGLTKRILGAELNKSRRMSNWEQRPLTPHQLQYAALDAAVLLRLFANVRSQSHSPLDWETHVVRHYVQSRKKGRVSFQNNDHPY